MARRKNPISGAAAVSEAFHGRPVETVTELVEELHEHTELAGLGTLLLIRLVDKTEITFDGETQLASNAVWDDEKECWVGTQLFAVDGDQSIDLDPFNVDESKESVVLGPVKYIEYETAKFHLGKEDRTSGPYKHRLGEESGDMPLLCYDTVNGLVSFVGGAYHIDVDIEGKYSAGIRN